MKKTVLFFCVLLGLAGVAQSQMPVFNVKGGLNFGKWKLDETSRYNHSRGGIVLGASAEWPMQDALSIQSGLEYAMFGSIFKGHGNVAKYKTSYLLLPVVGKYHFGHGISAHLGPQIGYLLSAKSNLDGEVYNFRDEMKKFDLFVVLGAEYELKNGLSVGFRIHNGLTNVEDGASTTIHNRGFSLMASYPIQGSVKETIQHIFKR